MDTRIATLESMLDKTATLIDAIDPATHQLPTPCEDLDVAGLGEHVAIWVQVFDGAVNDAPVDFDPTNNRIEDGWHGLFTKSASSIISGLRARGADRPMTMTSDPLPGEFVLAMLLMEYVGHGWDLAKATGVDVPFSDDEAATALAAATAILQPEHRGTGMFGDEVAVDAAAPPIDRFVGFIGRDPAWTPA